MKLSPFPYLAVFQKRPVVKSAVWIANKILWKSIGLYSHKSYKKKSNYGLGIFLDITVSTQIFIMFWQPVAADRTWYRETVFWWPDRGWQTMKYQVFFVTTILHKVPVLIYAAAWECIFRTYTVQYPGFLMCKYWY